MKVSPVRSLITNSGNGEEKASFKGRTVQYIAERPYIQAMGGYYPNSSIERTLEKYHNNKTGKIYFADPMEPINDDLRKQVDYVVYDNEPAYPDVNEEVSKNYFGTERVNHRTQYERIRDYFYRREQAGWADKAEAQYQQWQAAECIRLYDKAGDLRYQKETLENEVRVANNKIAQTENSLDLTKSLIAEKEVQIKNLTAELPDLEAKQAAYNNLKTELDKDNGLSTKEETAFVATGLATVGAAILAKISELESAKTKLENLKMRIGVLNGNMNGYKNIIETNTPKIADVKAKLIPLFDELKNFYARQGIKKF